jgi:hypothetical protein
MSLQGVDVAPGQYHEGVIVITATADGAPVGGVVLRLQARKSDGSATEATVTTTGAGRATARMRTTQYGDNELVVAGAEKEGCTWAQAGQRVSLRWQARP